MSEQYTHSVKRAVRKGRRQTSVWTLTDEMVSLLSEYMDITKTKVMHLAVEDMAKTLLSDSTDEDFRKGVGELLNQEGR